MAAMINLKADVQSAQNSAEIALSRDEDARRELTQVRSELAHLTVLVSAPSPQAIASNNVSTDMITTERDSFQVRLAQAEELLRHEQDRSARLTFEMDSNRNGVQTQLDAVCTLEAAAAMLRSNAAQDAVRVKSLVSDVENAREQLAERTRAVSAATVLNDTLRRKVAASESHISIARASLEEKKLETQRLTHQTMRLRLTVEEQVRLAIINAGQLTPQRRRCTLQTCHTRRVHDLSLRMI